MFCVRVCIYRGRLRGGALSAEVPPLSKGAENCVQDDQSF